MTAPLVQMASRLMRCSLSLLLVIGTVHVVDGKVSSGKALLTGEDSFALITKFAVSANENGSLDLNLSIPTDMGMYTDERPLKVSVFSEERSRWQKAKKESLCFNKNTYAKETLPVVFNSETKPDGKSYWIANVKYDIPPKSNDMYWYFALSDCTLEQTLHSIRDAPEMTFDFTVMNGDRHHSADEIGMNKIHFVQIFSSSLLLLWVIFKVMKAVTSSSSKAQIHVALLTVALAITCDIASVASEMVHSTAYSFNGVGSYTFDCFASHFEAQCDALMALVLILVGAGWTLPSDAVVSANQNSSMIGTQSWVQKMISGFRSPITAMYQLKSGNPAAILVITILALHAILAQWGRTFDDDFDTYHSLEHTPGRVLMWFRIMLGLVFLVGSSSVRNSGRCPRALQPFLAKFQLVGISWFISLPFVAMYVSKVMHSHQKHIALAIGSAMVQTSSLASLVWLFTADKDASPYHRMSNLQSENMSLSMPTAGSRVTGGVGNMWKIGNTKIRLD